jgi:phage protein D
MMRVSASETALRAPDPIRNATAYEQMLVKLAADNRTLKQISSKERKTPVAVKGFKRVIDEQAWVISRVVHNLNGNGYTTGLELEVKVSDVEYESEELTQ